MDITITITIPEALVESTVKSIMENFPEASSGNALRCIGWNYADCIFSFLDIENGGDDGPSYLVVKEHLLKAFLLLFTKKWPQGLTQPPCSDSEEEWNNWLCNCDAGDFDGFVQLAIFGEVIYG